MVLPWLLGFHAPSRLVSIASGGSISLFSIVHTITLTPGVRTNYTDWLLNLDKPMF